MVRMVKPLRYFAIYNGEKLSAIGTGLGGVEITETEYNALLQEIQEKAALVDKLYNEEIALADVPVEWQEEIERRVNERIEADGLAEEQPVSAAEFYSMIEEVL